MTKPLFRFDGFRSLIIDFGTECHNNNSNKLKPVTCSNIKKDKNDGLSIENIVLPCFTDHSAFRRSEEDCFDGAYNHMKWFSFAEPRPLERRHSL